MVRKLDKWVLHELTTNQTNHHFKVLSSFILSNSGEPFLDRIMRCNKKWFLYNNQWWPAQWLDWEEAPKHFPKPNLHQKEGHSHCLMVCCWSDPLQRSQSWGSHYIWEVHSTNWWDAPKTATPAARLGQQKRPSFSPWLRWTAHHSTSASNVEQTGLPSFASSAMFTWPLANWLPPLKSSQQRFARKMLPQPEGGRKCFPRFTESWSMGFYITGTHKLISHWQKCVDCNVSYFD